MTRLQYVLFPVLAALFLLVGVISPAMAMSTAPVTGGGGSPLFEVVSEDGYEIAYTLVQTGAIPTLAIQPDVMSSQMLGGANIIVGAIGVVIFLLIGMKLGGVIIRAISSAIDGLRI